MQPYLVTSTGFERIMELMSATSGTPSTWGTSTYWVPDVYKRQTPESYELQKTFREFLDAGCDTALMEVSSQGLMMDRVAEMCIRDRVCTAVSAAVNGRYLVTPHVVDKITDQNGNVVQEIGTNTRRQVISEMCIRDRHSPA